MSEPLNNDDHLDNEDERRQSLLDDLENSETLESIKEVLTDALQQEVVDEEIEDAIFEDSIVEETIDEHQNLNLDEISPELDEVDIVQKVLDEIDTLARAKSVEPDFVSGSVFETAMDEAVAMLSQSDAASASPDTLINEIEKLWSELKATWNRCDERPNTVRKIEELWDSLKDAANSGIDTSVLVEQLTRGLNQLSSTYSSNDLNSDLPGLDGKQTAAVSHSNSTVLSPTGSNEEWSTESVPSSPTTEETLETDAFDINPTLNSVLTHIDEQPVNDDAVNGQYTKLNSDGSIEDGTKNYIPISQNSNDTPVE